MKNFSTLFKPLLVLLLVTIAGAAPLFAQAATPENPFHQGTTVEEVFNWYTGVYGVVTMALTYLQGLFFKNAGTVPQTAVRYILVAAIVGGIFIALGWANGWQVAIGFLTSAVFYDKVLKPLGLKTPTPLLATPPISK